MTPAQWAWSAWGALAGVAYAWITLGATRGLYALRKLGEDRPPDPAEWPSLSVVIPACNEAATLGHAIETLLAQDYPGLEIVLVNDRSTDGTGALVDELGRRDPRIRPVHIDHLPPGWLGKVHALDQGRRISRSEWILFTDADVHHHLPGVLRQAVALGIHRSLDHVCLLPKLRSGSFWQECALDAFGISFFSTLEVHRLTDPESDAYVGVGAFNLVRREALDRSEGFEWLRLEVGDDVGLGYLIRRARGRAGLWLASRELSVLWYESFGAMARGLEKNLFGILGHYSVALAALRSAVAPLVVAGVVAGLLGPTWLGRGPALFAVLCVILTAFAMRRRIDQRLLPGLLAPLGFLLLVYMVLRSTWVCRRAGGITWRGTFYPASELAQLQRVKL